MSLSTWPAATLAKIRNPRDRPRKPTEMSSSKIEGSRRAKTETSMTNCKLRPLAEKVPVRFSTNRKTISESSKVETMSTMKVALRQERLRLRAKLRKTMSREKSDEIADDKNNVMVLRRNLRRGGAMTGDKARLRKKREILLEGFLLGTIKF